MKEEIKDTTVGIYETLLFLLFNIIYLMIGFILWHVLWVSRHGVEIPNLISKNTNELNRYYDQRPRCQEEENERIIREAKRLRRGK